MYSIFDIVANVFISIIGFLFFAVVFIPITIIDFFCKEGDPRRKRTMYIFTYGFIIWLTLNFSTMAIREIVLRVVDWCPQWFAVERTYEEKIESLELSPVADGVYLFRDEKDEVHFLNEDGEKKSADLYSVNYDTDKGYVEAFSNNTVAYFKKDVDKKYPIIDWGTGRYYLIHLSNIEEIQNVNTAWD